MARIEISQVVLEVAATFVAAISCPVTVPAGVGEGDYVLAVFTPTNQAAQVIVASGWAEVFPCENDPLVAPLASAVLARVASRSEPAAYTFQMDVGDGVGPYVGGIVLAVYRTVDPASPLNASAEAFSLDADATYDLPSVSPTAIGCALVGIMVQALDAGTPDENTAPSGYEKRIDTGLVMICDRLTGASTGATGIQTATKSMDTIGENTYHLALKRLG